MTTCSESGQVRKEAAIRSLCRASESIECAGILFCAVLPNRAMLDAARHPERQFVIQKARHDQKVYALPFSCQLVRSGRRSLALPKHRWLRGPGGGRALGVSLVLGFACGIARLPSALPALAGSQPKPPEGSHLSELFNPVPFAARWRCLGIDGYVVQEAAVLLLEFL